MKKLALIFLLAVAVASPALAGPTGQVYVGTSTTGYGPYEVYPGGEFTLTPVGTWITNAGYGAGARGETSVLPLGSFQTFCIEGNEFIYGNTTYTATLDTYAILGGMTGQTSPGKDPVSVGTGWLYKQFATGIWENGLTYNYGTGRATSAAALQNALWWLEGEEGIGYTASNAYMAAVVAEFGTTGAKLDGGGAYGVSALNIYKDGTNYQTQLWYDAGSTTDVPDGGATLMLLGGALVGLGALRRKFRG